MCIWSSALVMAGFEPAIATPARPNRPKTTSSTAMTVIEVGRFPISLPYFSNAQTSARRLDGNGVFDKRTNARSGALAGFREELGFLLAADALGHLDGVVGRRRVAAAMGQAEVVERRFG